MSEQIRNLAIFISSWLIESHFCAKIDLYYIILFRATCPITGRLTQCPYNGVDRSLNAGRRPMAAGTAARALDQGNFGGSELGSDRRPVDVALRRLDEDRQQG